MKNAILQTLHKKIVQAGAILDNYPVKYVVAEDGYLIVELEKGTVVSERHAEQLRAMGVRDRASSISWEMEV